MIDLVNFEQGDRLDRRAGQTALYIADHRGARLGVDGHAHEGVDHGEGVGAGLDAAPGKEVAIADADTLLVQRFGDILRAAPGGGKRYRRRSSGRVDGTMLAAAA